MPVLTYYSTFRSTSVFFCYYFLDSLLLGVLLLGLHLSEFEGSIRNEENVAKNSTSVEAASPIVYRLVIPQIITSVGYSERERERER